MVIYNVHGLKISIEKREILLTYFIVIYMIQEKLLFETIIYLIMNKNL